MDKEEGMDAGEEEEKASSTQDLPPLLDDEQDFAEVPVADDEPALEAEEASKELMQERDKYIRLYADFDNYKKRTSKEKADIYAYASLPLMEKLLSVMDSFDSALKDVGEGKEDDPIITGLKMVYNNFSEILKAEGLKAIPTVGEKFDPNLHNGIATDDSEDSEDEAITEEFIRGYIYKDRVIRPAMVKVNRKN